MVKNGIIVCNKKDVTLMELSSKYNIPLLFIDEELNIRNNEFQYIYVVLKLPFKMSYTKIYTYQNMNILYNGTKYRLFCGF